MANGYQGNNRSGYQGAGAKRVPTTSGNTSKGTTDAAVENKPAASLAYRTKEENAELVNVTGLFAATSGKGNKYYSVSVKEDITIPAGTVLMLFIK